MLAGLFFGVKSKRLPGGARLRRAAVPRNAGRHPIED